MRRKFLLAIAILIGIAGILAIGFGLVSKFLPPASVATEVIEVPDETPPSDGGLISQEELKAAGDRIVAGAQDFGSDCAAAINHAGGDARCREAGGIEMVISETPLPQDPTEKSAGPTPVAP